VLLKNIQSSHMHPKKIWANLAVSDLQRTTAFYNTLGFTSNGGSIQHCSFFFGETNFIIHFFLKQILQANINSNLVDPAKENEVIFSLSAANKEEVEAWVEKVKLAGGTIINGITSFEKGCYFVFADPDGHKFNVLYWPE